MAEDGRSLGVTLVAAASTFALFVVTSLPPVRSSFKWHGADLLQFVGESLDNLSVVAFLPVSPFITMLVKVMCVSQLRREFFRRTRLPLDVDYVSTMAFCRIFIELGPQRPDTASNLSSSLASPLPPPPLSPWLRCTHRPKQPYNPRDWEEGIDIDKERVFPHEAVESFDPLEICFATDDTNYAAQRHAGCFYLELHSEDRPTRDSMGVMRAECRRCLAREKGVLNALMQKMARFFQWPLEQQFKEREALILALKCPPQPMAMKLDFVRDKGRSVFPHVVRALQAMGYMWNVLERAVQQEPISPVEAILTFLSILVALQVLMELYATYFLSVTCVILALIGTIREWKLFNTPTTHIFYSWILPHISP